MATKKQPPPKKAATKPKTPRKKAPDSPPPEKKITLWEKATTLWRTTKQTVVKYKKWAVLVVVLLVAIWLLRFVFKRVPVDNENTLRLERENDSLKADNERLKKNTEDRWTQDSIKTEEVLKERQTDKKKVQLKIYERTKEHNDFMGSASDSAKWDRFDSVFPK